MSKSYKNFENEYVRMTVSSKEEADNMKDKVDEGIKVNTIFGELAFFPNSTMTDHSGEPILYIKFNHREKLVLYLLTQHPESRKGMEALKLSVETANMIGKENYVVRDIMDYIEEIEKILQKVEDGEINLNDGIHPDMKGTFEKLAGETKTD